MKLVFVLQVSGGQLPVVCGGGRTERRARAAHAAPGAQPPARAARARARAAAPPADAVSAHKRAFLLTLLLLVQQLVFAY